MRTSAFLFSLAFLFACGGGEAPAPDAGDAGQELESLRDAKPEEAEENETTPAVVVDPEAERRKRQADLILNRLKSVEDDFDRADLLARAIELGKDASPLWAELAPAMESDEEILREVVIRLAVAIRGSDARRILERGLKDDNETVRSQAARSWGDAKIADVGPLIELVENEIDPQVQRSAMTSIEAVGQAALLDRVIKLSEVLDDEALMPLVGFVKKHGTVAKASFARDMLERGSFEARAACATLLAEWNDKTKDTLLALCRLLEDDETMVRRAALDALMKFSEGKNFGFDPEGSEARRESAAAEWKTWAEGQG